MPYGPYAGGDLVGSSSGPFAGSGLGRDGLADLDTPSIALDSFQGEILRLREDYRTFHARRLSRHKTDETYFTLEYFVPTVDQNREPLKAPTAFQIVEEMINHVIAENPVITVMPRSRNKRAQEMASKQTSWVNGYWHKIDLTKILREMLWHDMVRGCHVVRMLLDDDALPLKPIPPVEPQEPENLLDGPSSAWVDFADELLDYESAKERYQERVDEYRQDMEETVPFRVEVVDPKYVLWEPSDEPQQCIVVWDRPVDEIMQRYPQTRHYLSTFQPGTKVTWCEYWNDRYFAYWIEPQSSTSNSTGSAFWVEEPMLHGYGFFPFIIDGPWRNPLQDADKMYPSLYFAIRPLLQYESTLMTQLAHLVRKLGWPILIVNTPDARSDNMKPKLDPRPGTHNYLGEDEQAHYLEVGAGTSSLLERVINGVDDYVQDASGMKDVLRGQPKGKSGYQQAQSSAAARVSLVPVEQCTQRTLQKATRFLFKFIRIIDERITVMAADSARDSETALGPNDVKQVGLIKVMMKTVLPIDEGAKLKNIMDMQKAGWFPAIEGARMAGIENPEEKAQAAQDEAFEREPEIQLAKALKHVRETDPDTWAIMQEFGIAQKLVQNLVAPPQPPGGAPPQGPTGRGAPARPTPPAAPGSAREGALARRQGAQGGQAPKQLPAEGEAA